MDRTKVRNAVGVALAAILLLLTLLGSGYFIFTLKVGFVQWLAFNACSPTSLVYLVCVTIFIQPYFHSPFYQCIISERWGFLPSLGVVQTSLHNYLTSL